MGEEGQGRALQRFGRFLLRQCGLGSHGICKQRSGVFSRVTCIWQGGLGKEASPNDILYPKWQGFPDRNLPVKAGATFPHLVQNVPNQQCRPPTLNAGHKHVPLTFLAFLKSVLPRLLVRIWNVSPSPNPAWRTIYTKLRS